MKNKFFSMSGGIQAPIEKYQNKWMKLYETEKPSRIYHYTDLSGVIGVSNSRQLWLSKASYMNDFSEIEFFIQRIFNVIDIIPRFGIDTNLLKMVSGVIQEIQYDVYICSFCEDGNLLSQWRAYADSASGVSVGFSSEILDRVSKKHGIHMIKCIYSQEEQDEIAISLVLDAIKLFDHAVDNKPSLEDIKERILLASLACKNPAFSEEQEWRLILIKNSESNHDVDVRAGRGMLIPYYKLDLPEWSEKGIIEDCYIGPTAKFHEIEEGLRILISKNICQSFTIRESGIPYR